MWRVTVILNSVLMFICWAGALAVSGFAHNRLVVYPPSDTLMALPTLTTIAFSIRPFLIMLPLVWAVLAVILSRLVGRQPAQVRNEWLIAFSLTTLAMGGGIVLFFLAAGLLPFMLISMQIG